MLGQLVFLFCHRGTRGKERDKRKDLKEKSSV
jgi:hypothetical protein